MKGTRNRIVDLVRQAKCELGSGNRSNALGLLKRALSMDPGGNTITETILTIEKELTGNTPREAGKKTTTKSAPPSKTAVSKPPPPAKASAPEPITLKKTPVVKPPAAVKKTAPTPTPSRKTASPRPSPPLKASAPEPGTMEKKPAAKSPAVETTADKKTVSVPAPAPRTPAPKPRTVERKPLEKVPAVEKKTVPAPTPAPRTPAPKPRTVERKPLEKPPTAVKKPAERPGSVSNITRSRRDSPKASSPTKDEESSQKRLIKEIFAISDSALIAGDETGALECLKRAKVLSPDNPEVKKRMDALRRTLKARVMIKTGCDLVAKGKLAEAVKSARKAFNLVPGLNGLRELISDIEDFASRESPSKKNASDYEDAEVWVSRIRSRIQEGAFPLAAELAAEACAIYPDHELIRTFVDRFTKMKLLPG